MNLFQARKLIARIRKFRQNIQISRISLAKAEEPLDIPVAFAEFRPKLDKRYFHGFSQRVLPYFFLTSATA